MISSNQAVFLRDLFLPKHNVEYSMSIPRRDKGCTPILVRLLRQINRIKPCGKYQNLYLFLFVWVEALRLSQQFFSHVGTEPPLPGYYQYFLGGKCILLKDTTRRPE